MASPQSKRSPAFQFYPKDFLTSPKVVLMSMTERGAYMTLLSHCWLDNGLPTDVRVLAKFCGMRHAQFERMWNNGTLHTCFHERGGKFQNDRLDRERKVQADYRKKQADNGAKGGRPKKAVGYSGETQPEPRKSSSSAFPSASSSAIRNPQGTYRAPTLVTPPIQHRNVAHFSPLGDVPNFVHDELVRKVANGGVDEGEANTQVRAFYATVERRFAGQVVGDPAPKFWREQFAAFVKTDKPMSDAAATVFETLGVKP